jgi:hypothetical protein
MMELYFHSPICLHDIVLNYIFKYRDNFTHGLVSYIVVKQTTEIIVLCEIRPGVAYLLLLAV